MPAARIDLGGGFPLRALNYGDFTAAHAATSSHFVNEMTEKLRIHSNPEATGGSSGPLGQGGAPPAAAQWQKENVGVGFRVGNCNGIYILIPRKGLWDWLAGNIITGSLSRWYVSICQREGKRRRHRALPHFQL